MWNVKTDDEQGVEESYLLPHLYSKPSPIPKGAIGHGNLLSLSGCSSRPWVPHAEPTNASISSSIDNRHRSCPGAVRVGEAFQEDGDVEIERAQESYRNDGRGEYFLSRQTPTILTENRAQESINVCSRL